MMLWAFIDYGEPCYKKKENNFRHRYVGTNTSFVTSSKTNTLHIYQKLAWNFSDSFQYKFYSILFGNYAEILTNLGLL